ncbi:MAG: hypothetical protein Q8L35_01005 [Actinomycetota bacterium]|nr:hypothetical protein [Actinomycetota bacterium]
MERKDKTPAKPLVITRNKWAWKGVPKIGKLYRLGVIAGFLAALTATPAIAGPIAAGLKVYPVKLNIDTKAGKAAAGDFQVINTAKLPADIKITAQDFTRDNQGNYKFLAPSGRPLIASPARWTGFAPANFRLKAGAGRKINVLVKVPDRAGPGGHYAMAFVTADPVIATGKKPKQAIIGRARIGVMLRVALGGRVVDRARLSRLEAPRLSWGGPIDFTIVFANKGNIHKDIAGLITINKDSAEATRLTVDEWTSLPGSDLRITKRWQRPGFGAYKVKALIASRDGKRWTKTAAIFVVPILPIAWLLAIIGLFLVAWRFLRRRYTFKMEKKVET